MSNVTVYNPQYLVTYILAANHLQDSRNNWSCVEYCLDAPQLVPHGKFLYDREYASVDAAQARAAEKHPEIFVYASQSNDDGYEFF